jgi:hypothetical protein
MKSVNLKALLILIPALLLAGCETANPPFKLDTVKYDGLIVREATSPGDLITRQANRFYEQNYLLAKRHKAMAQSVNGTWGWSHGQPTPEAAIDQALERCREKNEPDQKDKPCKLVIVDLYWTAEFFGKSN